MSKLRAWEPGTEYPYVPGLTGSKILFRSPEGSLFDIIGGPQEADGFSWWHVRDAQFQLEGWAVANYLQVTS